MKQPISFKPVLWVLAFIIILILLTGTANALGFDLPRGFCSSVRFYGTEHAQTYEEYFDDYLEKHEYNPRAKIWVDVNKKYIKELQDDICN